MGLWDRIVPQTSKWDDSVCRGFGGYNAFGFRFIYFLASTTPFTVDEFHLGGATEEKPITPFFHSNIAFIVIDKRLMQDGQKVVGAGADKAARILDLAANGAAAQQVAIHDAPVKSVRFFEAPNSNAPMIATASWDKTLKYWDLRQATPVGSITCQERIYSMDVQDKLLVIGTADRYINIINLDNPNTIFKTMQSPLKYQTRVVSCFNDAKGFAVGSIEGRSAFQWVDESKTRYFSPVEYSTHVLTEPSSNFSFKCHRDPLSNNNSDVYAVNAISFHPVHGTFSTAGSDGSFHFWDKEAKHRLKGYPSVGGSISATDFNRDGTIFAYAISYDWSKGFATNTANYPIKVMLHPVTGDECKPRVTPGKR